MLQRIHEECIGNPVKAGEELAEAIAPADQGAAPNRPRCAVRTIKQQHEDRE